MNNSLKVCCLLMATFPVWAQDMDYISNIVPDADVVGEARLKFLLWDVYDATLHAPEGEWQEAKPFALQLSYLLSLKGEKIAQRSVEEIRFQGFDDEQKLSTWFSQMKKIFPDVDEGNSITGIYTASKESIFYLDGLEIGRISDPEFGKAFFNIWLGQKTSEPDMRKKLLGTNDP